MSEPFLIKKYKGSIFMKLKVFVFSPTGGTMKVAKALANSIDSACEYIDLCSGEDFSHIQLNQDDVCIMAVPVFGGRVPILASKRLATLKANNEKAVLVAVYGNRAYEDALKELYDIANRGGFCVVGAITAIAKHSIVNEVATDRPNEEDIKNLAKMGEVIKQKIQSGSVLSLDSDGIYKSYNPMPIEILTSSDCVQCGLCARKCPAKAINMTDAKIINANCIYCMRCVSICPKKAKAINPNQLAVLSEKLNKICKEEKEYQLFVD